MKDRGAKKKTDAPSMVGIFPPLDRNEFDVAFRESYHSQIHVLASCLNIQALHMAFAHASMRGAFMHPAQKSNIDRKDIATYPVMDITEPAVEKPERRTSEELRVFLRYIAGEADRALHYDLYRVRFEFLTTLCKELNISFLSILNGNIVRVWDPKTRECYSLSVADLRRRSSYA